MSIPKMAEKGIVLPPLWCASICRNAMNEVCVEKCAIKRDCSAFEPTKDLKLADMPKFPETKNMTREERFTVVTVYLSKIVDQLQGGNDEPVFSPVRRPHTHSSTGSRVSPVVQIQTLLPDLTQAIPPLQDTEKRESARVRSEAVAQPAD